MNPVALTWQELIDKLANNLTPEALAQPAVIEIPSEQSMRTVADVDIDTPKIVLGELQ